MIRFIKHNKILFILLILSFLVFLFGFVSFYSMEPSIKSISFQNIQEFLSQIKSNSYSFSKLFFPILFRDSIFVLFIWIFGISIIGIILLLFFYFFEVFLFSLEISSLFFYFHKIPIAFFIFFLLIKTIKVFLYFILVYYSSSFSILLFRFLFLQREYPIKKIFKRYLKIFLILFFFLLFIILIESLSFSKILIYFI